MGAFFLGERGEVVLDLLDGLLAGVAGEVALKGGGPGGCRMDGGWGGWERDAGGPSTVSSGEEEVIDCARARELGEKSGLVTHSQDSRGSRGGWVGVCVCVSVCGFDGQESS